MISKTIVHQPTTTARQRALLRWYARHGRHSLPWRHRITPYRVLVSEVMLQQTQVDRVIPYFNTWMKRWPTVGSFARAKRSDVIRAWAGLGYNRRAVYLHRAAQEIIRDPALEYPFAFSHEKAKGSARGHAVSPSNWDGSLLRVRARGSERGRKEEMSDITHLTSVLRRLPGVGSYTANAILAFAWNLPAPCVDVNVRRVLAYAICKRSAIMRMPLAHVERLAARVVPKGQGRVWNYALMDYGALVLRARDVPKRNRPKSTQGRFENSTRFWRGRIVAVLRGDASTALQCSNAKENRKNQMYTLLDGRLKVCTLKNGNTIAELRHALTAYGVPPPLTPLLAALVRDGVVVRRGRRYAFP